MDGLTAAQLADDIGDIVFLEEANGGDAGGSDLEAGWRVLERDASERENGNFVLAGLAKRLQSGCLRAGNSSFFENWGEEGEVSSRDCGPLKLTGSVTRHADSAAGGGARAT